MPDCVVHPMACFTATDVADMLGLSAAQDAAHHRHVKNPPPWPAASHLQQAMQTMPDWGLPGCLQALCLCCAFA
jgi:hypothetical protein